MLMKSLALAALAATLAIGTASAQENYPTQPITIVVPFTAGGPTDTVTRLVAQSMSADLGQQVLVQNVGGAGGTLGAGQVAKAKPDGYTLLLHHIGMSTSPTLYRQLAFDPVKDFSPIGLVTAVPMTIVGRKDFEPNTMEELVAYLKANGADTTYANAGIGSASHLCGMLLQEAVGVQFVTVPYQGAAPMMTDLLGGQVDMMCDQTTNTTNQIKAKEIKAYAVTTPERLASLPDLPTTKEGGLPKLDVAIWHALYGPAGMDPAVVAKLEASLKKALKDETVVRRFAELGTTPVAENEATPDALRQQLASQIELWRPIIQAAGQYAN
ncbi:tripartite tricarboxylate transporter substrate-binding protein [Aureimonas leprariae]|uniref:Tripartite tricarboxylate transporter substrate binding protein BugD n=1 Tax=Plantimonas leprariae TaxID=2615207 RepID=A0A7V7TZS8_9HYPH|nr:tripartite tricarboxylate transporter substrate-binding protein [Aureimonas leprariae]KAB0679731.1 tripartite tricarboxylate transporter substrate binding protein BugD [Aureimonas leprariae]